MEVKGQLSRSGSLFPYPGNQVDMASTFKILSQLAGLFFFLNKQTMQKKQNKQQQKPCCLFVKTGLHATQAGLELTM